MTTEKKPRKRGSGGARAGAGAPGPVVETPEIVAAADGEPVGVTADPDPPPAGPVVPELDTYFCLNCKSTITLGDTKCPTCEVELSWPEAVKP